MCWQCWYCQGLVSEALYLQCLESTLLLNCQELPRLISLAYTVYRCVIASFQAGIGNLQRSLIVVTIMRLRAGLLWASAVLQAGAVSAQALIYTSEVNAPLSNGLPPSISPITARLLLAQRLGLSQYHSLEDADESTLEVLNDYGGRQGQVFEDEEQIRGAEKLLLIVDGVSNPQGTSRPLSWGKRANTEQFPRYFRLIHNSSSLHISSSVVVPERRIDLESA